MIFNYQCCNEPTRAGDNDKSKNINSYSNLIAFKKDSGFYHITWENNNWLLAASSLHSYFFTYFLLYFLFTFSIFNIFSQLFFSLFPLFILFAVFSFLFPYFLLSLIPTLLFCNVIVHMLYVLFIAIDIPINFRSFIGLYLFCLKKVSIRSRHLASMNV